MRSHHSSADRKYLTSKCAEVILTEARTAGLQSAEEAPSDAVTLYYLHKTKSISGTKGVSAVVP